MKLLVTGASGFIGASVVRQAVAAGHQVRGLVRPGSRTERIDDLPWQRAAGDVRDGAAVLAAVGGCDAVIHLAAVAAWDRIDSPEVPDVIVNGTAAVLRAARQIADGAGTGQRAPRVVIVSSAAAMGGTESPRVLDETSALPPVPPELIYGVAKREAEALALAAAAAGLPVMVARPTEVYGPADRDLVTARTLIDFAGGFPVLVCDGGTSVVHVDDVARALLEMVRVGRAGQIYLLGGDNLTLRQLAALASTAWDAARRS